MATKKGLIVSANSCRTPRDADTEEYHEADSRILGEGGLKGKKTDQNDG